MAFSAADIDEGPKAEINVVPLVDIMLVMLVIFMITAPIMQQGVEVNLPKATTAPLAGSNEQVVLSIDKGGTIFLGSKNELSLSSVGPKLKAIMERRSVQDQKIYIKADQGVSYGRVMEVMGRIHAAGLHQIGLISAPEDGTSDQEQPKRSSKGKSSSKKAKK